MSDSSTDESGDAARMELEPDALHEGDFEEPYFDCPSCGSPATITQIVEEGRCSGYLDEDDSETGGGEEMDGPACTAKLSLELVWEE